jgi:hypothetical protein
MSTQNNAFSDLTNPLDHVEEILNDNNWVFSRMNEDELMVNVTGKSCNYRLFFVWHEAMSAMQFCCQYDFSISPHNLNAAARALIGINESMWIGHFDLSGDAKTPCFRHTVLFRGQDQYENASEQIADLVDICMNQCEDLYSLFQMLRHEQPANEQSLSLAVMQTRGAA